MEGKKIEKQFFVGTILGLIIGLSILALVNFGLPLIQKNKVAEDVRKLYEIANPGSSVEIVSIKEEGNLYKILLRINIFGGTNYLETYVTKDGRYLSENVIFVRESIDRIERMKKFIDCLFDKNVRIFGAMNTNVSEINTATQLQLNILGRYSGKIYVSCDGDAIQQCINIGLTSLPALVYQNQAYYGVFTAEAIANLTGCKL
ncbi:MAG: hypothetical protein QXW01_03165 [Candidatus Aenigmatarchaeota archaeon]